MFFFIDCKLSFLQKNDLVLFFKDTKRIRLIDNFQAD